ncbi:MAG: apolipoprotein N-acyltransferase, partial [Sphingomonadales bacterium]
PVGLVMERGLSQRILPVAVGGLLVAALLAGGWWRLPAGDAPSSGVEVRVVQANIDQRDKWSREMMSENFVRQLEMSAAPRAVPADVIVWPETAVAYFLDREPARRFLIAEALPDAAYLITGTPRMERYEDGSIDLWNSVQVIDGQGRIAATYDKTHLVPFGEYLPMRDWLSRFGLSRFVPSDYDFSAGDSLKTVRLPALPAFSALICYEIIFPGAVTRNDDRPEWIVNVTNDAWYGNTSGPHQHLTAARMRAVEEGLPVVRAAGTGISAVIDPWGRTVGEVALDAEGVIDAALPRMVEGRTVYARLGDWGYGGLVAIIALLAFSSVSVRPSGGASHRQA